MAILIVRRYFQAVAIVDTQQQKVVTLGQRMHHIRSAGKRPGANGVTLPAPSISSGLGIPFWASSQNIPAANQNTVLNLGPLIVSSPNFPSSPTTSFGCRSLQTWTYTVSKPVTVNLHLAMATPRRRSTRLSEKSSTPEVSANDWYACDQHFTEDDSPRIIIYHKPVLTITAF